MGNSVTKEARPPGSTTHRGNYHRGAIAPSPPHRHDRSSPADGSRRSSRPDLSIFGISGSGDREVQTLEHRRETKQEREARRLERERANRIKERERSMKEEHVDGGYLVTQGVYVGTEDFSKQVVRQLMIERRIAPFWRGLNDFSDSWTEHQLMAAARGLPIPAPDEIPPELDYKNPPSAKMDAQTAEKNLQNLTVPISSRSQSFNSDRSSSPVMSPIQSLPGTASPLTGSASSPLFRGRAKTLAALTSSKNSSQTDMSPREIRLFHDPFVNGQPIEAYLYKDATECPICFLYYPPYLNRTRCCDQPICSECFVQIKRPDPHPPEHEQPDPNAAPVSEAERAAQADLPDGQLVSEPSACPFCVQPEFGVTFAPPPFRRGLVYSTNLSNSQKPTSPMSSNSSLVSANLASPVPTAGRRRATSLSANSPQVVTTDKIRPDWAQKLANARAHQARRSAAATALHTAAYLMNTPGNAGDSRNFAFGRRGVLRRTGGSDSPSSRTGSPHLNALAFLSERRAGAERENESGDTSLAPPRGSSRRSRMDDLEEMMMMEAIRLSLASEEERRKREEKEAKKEAKKRQKEAKKAEKVARKTGLYSNNPSSATLDFPTSAPVARIESAASSKEGDGPVNKGKAVDRAGPSTLLESSETQEGSSGTPTAGPISSEPPQLSLNNVDFEQSSSLFPPSPTEPPKPSHLRYMSSASSSASSLVESVSGEHIGSGSPANGGSANVEPMFNFRSLAAVIGDEEKTDSAAEHVEDAQEQADASKPAADAAGSSDPSKVGAVGEIPVPSASTTAATMEGEVGNQVDPVETQNSSDIPATDKRVEAQSIEIVGAVGEQKG